MEMVLLDLKTAKQIIEFLQEETNCAALSTTALAVVLSAAHKVETPLMVLVL
jgi:hypothetical protein